MYPLGDWLWGFVFLQMGCLFYLSFCLLNIYEMNKEQRDTHTHIYREWEGNIAPHISCFLLFWSMIKKINAIEYIHIGLNIREREKKKTLHKLSNQRVLLYVFWLSAKIVEQKTKFCFSLCAKKKEKEARLYT